MTERDWGLRITARCLRDDLGIASGSPARAEEHVGVHQIVRAFVERRGQSPIGQETFRCGTEVTGRPLYTLHSGDDRGATWHQESVAPSIQTDFRPISRWALFGFSASAPNTITTACATWTCCRRLRTTKPSSMRVRRRLPAPWSNKCLSY